MCEDIRTPARDEAVDNDYQQRRFTSFFISDILAERSDELRESIARETNVYEVDDNQEGDVEISLKGTTSFVRLVFS
jgi:hypothetical protein